MAGELLIDEPLDGVRRLTISNPAKRNALDHAILDGIAEAVHAADGDGVRCLMLTGADGMFSSGYDIGDIPDDVFAPEAEKLVAHPFTARSTALDATDMPTVAALPGHTIGGGLELALACDLRVARDGIKLGMPPAKLGLVYSHTGLRRFLDAIGEPRTRQLFLLGRNINARDARRLGARARRRRRRGPRGRRAGLGRASWRPTRRCRSAATSACCARCWPPRARCDADDRGRADRAAQGVL